MRPIRRRRPASAWNVRVPAMPSAASRFFAWKRASAAAVAAVNRPSTAFGLRPNGIELELERRDVPADGSDGELALPEQGPSERPERRSRRRLDAPRDRDALLPLEARQARDRQWPLDAVDAAG